MIWHIPSRPTHAPLPNVSWCRPYCQATLTFEDCRVYMVSHSIEIVTCDWLKLPNHRILVNFYRQLQYSDQVLHLYSFGQFDVSHRMCQHKTKCFYIKWKSPSINAPLAFTALMDFDFAYVNAWNSTHFEGTLPLPNFESVSQIGKTEGTDRWTERQTGMTDSITWTTDRRGNYRSCLSLFTFTHVLLPTVTVPVTTPGCNCWRTRPTDTRQYTAHGFLWEISSNFKWLAHFPLNAGYGSKVGCRMGPYNIYQKLKRI